MAECNFTIYGRLPGLNEYTTANRNNRYAGAKMKAQAQQEVEEAIARDIPRVQFKKPVVVSFDWIEPNRRRDLDNIAFAKKFILDAMVARGVIPNDDWDHVKGLTDRFGIDGKFPRIVVWIKEW